MITQEKIDRINALARKAKTPEGLTAEETAERAALRQEYVAAVRAILEAQLDNIVIQEPDGTRHRLPKKSREAGGSFGRCSCPFCWPAAHRRGASRGGERPGAQPVRHGPGAGGRHFRPASVRPGPEPPHPGGAAPSHGGHHDAGGESGPAVLGPFPGDRLG